MAMARLELQSVVLRTCTPLGRRASGSQSYRHIQRAHVSPQTGKPTPRIQPYPSIPWTCGRVSHQLLFCLARFSARLHFGARTCLSTLKFSEPSRLTIGHLTRQRARTGNELLRNPRNLSATSAGPLRGTLRMTGHRAMRIGKRSHYMLHVGTPPTDVALHGQLDLTQWSQRFPIVIPSSLSESVPRCARPSMATTRTVTVPVRAS